MFAPRIPDHGPVGDWREKASCVTSPDGGDLWFSTTPSEQAQAIAICHTCPVIRPCRRYARTTRPEFGIWGGHVHTPPRKRSSDD